MSIGVTFMRKQFRKALKMWLLPASFVTAMSAGILFGAPIGSASVESAVAVSVLCLGLVLAFDAKLPLPVSIGIVAMAAFVHGTAHATGQTLNSAFAALAAGALMMTALLHAAGVLAARGVREWPAIARVGGVVMAVFGLGLLTGILSA